MQEENKSSLFWILLGIGLISILVVTTPTSEAGIFDGGFIPPTPSFSSFNTTGSSIIAGAYNDFIEFVAGTGMIIVMNDITNEATFSTTTSGGNVVGEGVQGRLAIWNDTTKINSTANLSWDFNNNIFNIANGHFFNSTHFNIGTSRILGSMTCSNGDIIEYQISNNTWICGVDDGAGGEANTASNIGTDTGIFKSKVGVDLQFKSIRAGSNVIFTSYPDEILINATSSGGATTMESLTNVTDTGCALNQVLAVNSTAFWDCSTPTTGINSLNFTTSSNFNFNHHSNATTIELVSETFVFDLKDNVVLTNGSAQTVTKSLILDALKLGGNMDANLQAITNVISIANPASFVNFLNDINVTSGGINMTGSNVVLDINTNKIRGSMTCTNGQILQYDLATDTWTCNTLSGGGNATVLTELGDVIISGSAIDHILQHDGTTYVNKRFKIDNQTNNNGGDFFVQGIDNQTGDIGILQFSVNNQTNNNGGDRWLTGIDNVTGAITTSQFSVNTISQVCSGTDKVSTVTIDNVTGAVVITCSADAGGSGGGIPKPPQKKWGQFIPLSTSTAANGLLTGAITQAGTESFQYNTTHAANAIRTISTSGAGQNAGISWLATDHDHYRGDQNAYLYAKFVQERITLNRLFIGFISGTTPMPNNNDSVILSVSGVGLCVNSTSTVFNFCHNDGDAVTSSDSFGITENANAVHYVEIYTTDSGVTWCGKLDGGTAVCAASEIPAVTTRLRANVDAESTSGQIAFWYYHVYTENDK